jgi:hypothetical protein
MTELFGAVSYRRYLASSVVAGIGVITGVIHVDHLLEDTATVPVISSIVFPLCLSLGLIGAGYWLWQGDDYTDAQIIKIAGWSIAGAVFLTLLGTFIVLYQSMAGVESSIVVLAASVTEGAALGSVFGGYRAYDRRQ